MTDQEELNRRIEELRQRNREFWNAERRLAAEAKARRDRGDAS